jgi:hypothetical protein
MRPCRVVFSVAVASALVAVGSGWSAAHAQAWVADKGALDLSLDYNFATSDKVVADSAGMDFLDAGTTTHQFTVGAEYVPIDRLAVNVALPFALLTYNGILNKYPHPGGGSYDDGSAHATLTDLRVGARYQVLDEPLAVTPHIAVSIPVASYETVGNTVAGRHLKALHLGLGLGRVIGEATYVHVLYELSLVERYDRTPVTALYGQNRSDFAATIGHKLLDQKLDIHIDANGRITHGGVNFSEINFLAPASDPSTFDVAQYHDAILAENIYLVGGGVGYQLSNALGLNLSGRLFVAGKNTQNASVIAAGVTWSPL